MIETKLLLQQIKTESEKAALTAAIAEAYLPSSKPSVTQTLTPLQSPSETERNSNAQPPSSPMKKVPQCNLAERPQKDLKRQKIKPSKP